MSEIDPGLTPRDIDKLTSMGYSSSDIRMMQVEGPGAEASEEEKFFLDATNGLSDEEAGGFGRVYENG
ncbi:hypothetical protein ACFL1M_03900 [Patescibacteria group bacterium]